MGLGVVAAAAAGAAVAFYPHEPEGTPPPATQPSSLFLTSPHGDAAYDIAAYDIAPGSVSKFPLDKNGLFLLMKQFYSLTVEDRAGRLVYRIRVTANGDELVIDAEDGKLLSPSPPPADTPPAGGGLPPPVADTRTAPVPVE